MVKQIHFSFAGEGNWEWNLITRSLLTQQVLLSIRKEAKSPSEISSEINADESYIKDQLDFLTNCQLTKRTDENRYIANIILLSNEERKPFIESAKESCKELAKRIEHEMPNLKAAFESCSFRQQGYSWEQMDYVILAALLVDLGINTSLVRNRVVPSPPKRIDGGHWYYWGIEGGNGAKRHFGTEFTGDEKGGTGHIQSGLVKQPSNKPLDPNGRSIMLALYQKPLTIREIAEATGLSIDVLKGELEHLSSLGYFTEERGKYHCNFPIFSSRDNKIMTDEVMRVADSVVECVLKPRELDFRLLFEETGLARLEREYGAYLCMMYHTIMYHTLDALVETNLLPELPSEASATWGFWGWIGKLDWSLST